MSFSFFLPFPPSPKLPVHTIYWRNWKLSRHRPDHHMSSFQPVLIDPEVLWTENSCKLWLCKRWVYWKVSGKIIFPLIPPNLSSISKGLILAPRCHWKSPKKHKIPLEWTNSDKIFTTSVENCTKMAVLYITTSSRNCYRVVGRRPHFTRGTLKNLCYQKIAQVTNCTEQMFFPFSSLRCLKSHY